MKKYDVLYVVDDDDTYQFIAQKIIAATGLVGEVKSFANGRDAIDFLSSSGENASLLPDIILLDLTMPVLDGWGFMNDYVHIQDNLCKKSEIFIVSSSINPVDAERAKNFSVVKDYIIKPVTEDKFQEMICGL